MAKNVYVGINVKDWEALLYLPKWTPAYNYSHWDDYKDEEVGMIYIPECNVNLRFVTLKIQPERLNPEGAKSASDSLNLQVTARERSEEVAPPSNRS